MKRALIGSCLMQACESDGDRKLLAMFVNASGMPWLGDYLRPHVGRFVDSPRLRDLVTGGDRGLVPGTLHRRGEDVLLYADAGVAVFGTGTVIPVDQDLGLAPVCRLCRDTWGLWRAAGIGPQDLERAVRRASDRHIHDYRESLLEPSVAQRLGNNLWLMGQSLKEKS